MTPLATVQSDPYTAIVECLGAAASEYAANKQRGGSNGKKGSRYEDFFLAYKAAEIAAEHLDGLDATSPLLRGQCIGFVDDVVVSAHDKTQYFQLKNVANVSWAAGKHPIETDFSHQYTLASHLQEPNPTTALVVSDPQLQQKLSKTLPAAIKAHSEVHFFPYCDGHLNRLVIESEDVQNLLRQLAKVENPNLDELAGVFGILIIACGEHPEGARVNEIVKTANSFFPNQLRSFSVADKQPLLSEEFVCRLAMISGLSYAIERGFFRWAAFGTSGVFGFDCTNEQFKQFQEDVVQQQPTTFEEFERLLP